MEEMLPEENISGNHLCLKVYHVAYSLGLREVYRRESQRISRSIEPIVWSSLRSSLRA